MTSNMNKETECKFNNCTPFETKVLMAIENECPEEVIDSLFNVIRGVAAHTIFAYPATARSFFTSIRCCCKMLIAGIPEQVALMKVQQHGK